jgi:hypothetical protein
MATQNKPTLIDEERLRNVLARAATHSRDAGLVERHLVNGAGSGSEQSRTSRRSRSSSRSTVPTASSPRSAPRHGAPHPRSPLTKSAPPRCSSCAHPWTGCYPDLRAILSCGPPLGRRCVHCEEKP